MSHAFTTADGERGSVMERLARQEEEIASLSTELLHRYEEATFVYRLSERIGRVLGEVAIVRLVLDDVVAVLDAPAGVVWMRADDGAWREAAAFPADVAHPPLHNAPGLRETLESGHPWMPEGTTEGCPALAVGIPGAGDALLGGIGIAARTAGRPYRSGDLKLLNAVAMLASAFLRNHRLAEKARRADARQREDDIAREIHRGLLPRRDPGVAGLDVSGGFRAAELVGGDFYGYVVPADGTLGVAIADVSGHGVGAALYMATAKGAIQSEGRRVASPREVLARTNQVLLGDFSGTDVFTTAFYARFYPDAGRMVFANAGHNPPLLVPRDGSVVALHAGGPALGVLAEAVYREETVRFAEGDMLIAYTDGLIEARDPARRFFGTDRLAAIGRSAGHAPAKQVKERIFADLQAHLGGGALRDDVTVVVVRGTSPRKEGSNE